MNSYTEAASKAKELHNIQSDISARIEKFVSDHGGRTGRMGITPDHIKAMPEWKSLYQQWRAAWTAYGEVNAFISKRYAKEHRAAITESRKSSASR